MAGNVGRTPARDWVLGLCAAALAVCTLALIGWATGFERLTRAVPDLPSMKVNGALAFGSLALAVAAEALSRRRAALLLAGLALGVAMVTGAQTLLGLDFGIDQRWVADRTPGAGAHPGRMALATVACLVLLALALIGRQGAGAAAAARIRLRPGLLTSVALVIAYVASMGLLAQADWSAALQPLFGQFSVPTAGVVLLIGIAQLQLDDASLGRPPPEIGGAGRAGRAYARVALPVGLMIPVTVAWLSTASGLWINGGRSAPVAGALAATGVLFALLVLASAGWIERLERALHDERSLLEQRVDERTSQWREAERREAFARQQLDTIVNNAGVAIVALDDAMHVRWFNTAAERLFGIEAAQMMGRSLEQVLPAAVRPAHARWVEAFAAGPGSPRRMGHSSAPVSITRPDGGSVPVEATIATLSGEPPLLTVVLRDLSALQALEAERLARERTEAAHRAKSELMSQVGHEVRTPLNAILGFSELLAMDGAVRALPKPAQYVDLIVAAGRALLRLTEDLSLLGRLDAGAMAVRSDRVAVMPMVDRCLALQSDAAARAGLVWPSRGVGPADLEVTADADRVQQILLNLLSNAVKYGRAGGAVGVRVEAREPGRAVIHVDDQGLGMTADQLAHAFEPYDRAGRESSRIPGTGLGLAISRRLATAMGGRLDARSTPGVGSTFSLELPRAD